MVWKVFFVIVIFILILLNILGYTSNYTAIPPLQYIISLFINICFAFVLGIFYSLGWKQQLLSKKITNIFIAIFIISMILYPIVSAIQAYPSIYAEIQNREIAIISSIIGTILLASIINILFVPFYIGLYKYKKNFDILSPINKPYWKLFSIYFTAILVSFTIAAFTKFNHFSSYNAIDFFIIFSGVYEILFMIGFAWDVKIFNRLFWQITAILYVILSAITPIYMSNIFNQDFHIKDFFSSNPFAIITSAALYIVYFYMLFNYAYKKIPKEI